MNQDHRNAKQHTHSKPNINKNSIKNSNKHPHNNNKSNGRFCHNVTNNILPKTYDDIATLSRSFTLDNPNINTWKNNLLQTKSNIKTQSTTIFNQLYPEENNKKLLDPAYNILEKRISMIIENRMKKCYFNKTYYYKKQNTNFNIRNTLVLIKKDNSQTLIESDKNMGEVYIMVKDLNIDAEEILLKDKNYIRIYSTEAEVSISVRRETNKLISKFLPLLKDYWFKNPSYWKYTNRNKNLINNNNFLRIPKLRLMRKLHKPKKAYRRTLNVTNWYTNFLGEEVSNYLNDFTILYCEYYDCKWLLENSFELISEYNSLNNKTIKDIKYNKYYRMFLDMDVVKLYDMLQIPQSIKALESANTNLNYNLTRFNLIIEYLLYIQNNSFIKHNEIIVQQILGTGTGYKHSKPLADFVLLIWEHKNNEIFKSFTHYNELYYIRIRKRYVDDIKLCIDIIKDKFNNINEIVEFGNQGF